MTCTCLYNNTAEGASSIHMPDARCPEHGGKRMTKPNLEAFAREVMNTFWADRMFPDEPDGGTLQDIAEKHGVLLPHAVTEPCGEHCACAEYADFPTTCYRMNPAIEKENAS